MRKFSVQKVAKVFRLLENMFIHCTCPNKTFLFFSFFKQQLRINNSKKFGAKALLVQTLLLRLFVAVFLFASKQSFY